ncbi:MAG: hypothetical protein JNK84_08495 [Phreatobacter sp.]|uniref:hypothetical protein n=1 Tax=Phreatobacter sp. TaxID=1966341 RepID=UPI001A3FD639|nr:hypothetical protein [Phreatobacter sp.]MBL8569110.1 hypothetical protein [Phreatobacter sp.]
MNKMSKLLALSAVAGLGMAAALVLAPAGRAAVNVAPSLTVAHTAADIDHALGAFNGFRNRLDAAPARTEAPRQVAAIQGDRTQAAERSACAQHAWPHIPQNCQTSAAGQHLRQIRTVNTDAATR